MDDAGIVCGFERLGDLSRDRQRLVERQRTARDELRQILALDELHDQGAHLADFLEAVQLRDMRMVEGGERAGFAREARRAIGIARDRFRKNLQRDVALEPGIARAIHLAHPAGAERRNNFVVTDAGPGGNGHVRPLSRGCDRSTTPNGRYRITI